MTPARSPVLDRREPWLLQDGSLARTEVVSPGMCGPTALFAGRVGDWSWDAVSAACGIDAYAARDESGAPTYLSFSYFRLRGSRSMHPRSLTFGDRLNAVSRVYGVGSESVLTLHRIGHAAEAPHEPLDAREFYRYDDPASLYVENFNRWLVRTREHSNRGLASSRPAGFYHRHLPTVPAEHSPRRAYAHARAHDRFPEEVPADHTELVTGHVVDYPIDPARDLNGVGLLYFATYFGILDWALLRLWRRLGRDDRDFLDRVVLDEQVCYLGNADSGTVVRARLNLWRSTTDPRTELVEAVLGTRGEQDRLAVCRMVTRRGEEHV